MKKIFLVIAFLLPCLVSFSQIDQPDSKYLNFKVSTSSNATYPGGDTALYRRFFNEMKYPEAARAEKIETDIYVSFFVEADGSVSDVKAMSDPGKGLAEEAVRLVKDLKFQPAIQNGKAVRQNMMLSVPFRLYE